MNLGKLTWLPESNATFINNLTTEYAALSTTELDDQLHALVQENRTIHEQDCINLNPATNIMNPRAEALLADPHWAILAISMRWGWKPLKRSR